MKFLFDTDTCIAILRGNERMRERLQAVHPNDCGISMVSIFELLSEVERCRRPEDERRKVEFFLTPLHLFPFDHESAKCAAKIRWILKRSDQPIGPYDLQIAAQALALDVTLIAGNTGEFGRVPDLRVENWIR